MDDELYQANILDHYRNPRHHGALVTYTHREEGKNPSCGDELVVYVNVKDHVLIDATFEGEGCAISQAATSMVLEHMVGKPVSSVLGLSDQDLRVLLGVPIGESREKCMMLGLETLKAALTQYA